MATFMLSMSSTAPALPTVYPKPNSAIGIFTESIVEPIGTPLGCYLLRRALSVVRRSGNFGTALGLRQGSK